MNGHTLNPSHSHARPPRRRFGLFPVRKRGSAIADAIEAGREDPGAVQALGELRETLDEAMPEPFIAPQFTGAPLEPLPREPFKPLQRPVMTEAQLAQLARVADRLRAWEPAGEPERDEDEPDLPPRAPSAWMRSWQHDGRVLPVALWGFPSFAGVTAGDRLAGLYLGDADTEGRFAIDAPSAQWLDELIAAARQARDALVYGRGLRPVPEDDTMMLRPVHAEGGAA